MHRLLLIILVSVTTPLATADETPHSRLEVSGQGKATLLLDRARINFSFTALHKKAAEATQSVESRHANVLDKLTGLDIERKHIDDSSISIHPVYAYEHKKRVYKGLRYTRSTTIRNLKLDHAGKIIETLVANQVDNLSQPHLYSDNTTTAAREALGNAVQDAMQKAEIMADNASIRLGEIISLSEGAPPGPVPVLRGRAMAMSADAVAPEIAEIHASETNVNRSVRLVIELLSD